MGTYLVTGASGGMGLAVCRMLTGEGHRVWGLDRREPETGELWRFLAADVTDSSSLEAAYQHVSTETDILDGIVHTAGIYDLNSLVEMSETDFLRDFDVNLFGMFRVNKQFLPLLHRGGRIVMISSELAPLDPLPFTGIYALTKTAVEHYASALRMELQLLGIRVVVVRPGAVRTAMLGASTEKLSRFCEQTRLYSFNAARFRQIVDRVETKNVPPERIAETVRKALTAARPRLIYNVNRNPLLRLLNVLPDRLWLRIIRRILS